MSRTEHIDWDFIVRSINQKKTVLFIGPGITINYQEPDREARFLKEEIAQKSQEEVFSFHEEDGFLIFKDENAKLLNLYKISRFYELDFTNPVLEKISEIPFHLIISVTPDLSLNRIFDARGFDYFHYYYKTKIKQKIEFQPEANRPLIFNLLGCVDSPESLITSHYDLFSLIQSIYADRNLPEEITSVFNRDVTQNIIFLGFDFNKWYFQLILHLLKINYDHCIRYAASQEKMGEHLQMLCKLHFKIIFVNNDPVHFVNALHGKFPRQQLRQSLPKSNKRRIYKKKNIIKFLGNAFNAGDFDTFCLIHFEEVQKNFTNEQSQSTRIRSLIDYAEKFDEWEELLNHAKEENPVQYQKFEPYYDEF